MEKKFTGANKILRSESMQRLLNMFHDGTFKDLLADWKWVFGYSKKYTKKIVIYTLLGLLSSTLGLLTAYLSKAMINAVNETDFRLLAVMATGYFLMIVASIALDSLSERIYTKIELYVKNDIASDYFIHVLNADWMKINGYSNGDLTNRFTGDIATVAAGSVGWIPDIIINLYTFVSTFIVVFTMDITMALISLLSAPFLLLISRFVIGRMKEYKSAVLQMKSKMTAYAVECYANLDLLKSIDALRQSTKRLHELQKQNTDTNLDYNKFQIKVSVLSSALSSFVAFVAFTYCVFSLRNGRILFGDMTFFLSRRATLSNRFKKLVDLFPQLIGTSVCAKRIRELLSLPAEERSEENKKTADRLALDGVSLCINDVAFSYEKGRTVYENCSFEAHPQEIVAVLGASGGGKTTLLRLILGLLKPENGSVAVQGADGVSYPVNADFRCLFSYVPQGNTALSGSIRDNLLFVKEDATEEEMINALRKACAWEFVSQSPDGLDMNIGEHGNGISEGQAQRLCIARALLTDAPILLLDEATAALDDDTEHRVLCNMMTDNKKTCIVSTHRKSILTMCCRIYVIRENRMEMFHGYEEYKNRTVSL